MKSTQHRLIYLWLGAAILLLNGCASDRVKLAGSQSNVFSSKGSCYKVGKPYKIRGQWYYPKEDYSYSEVGMASWYGKDFHAKYTANGEVYDMNTLTAAHRTLPLPSIVRVTNLENGRSVILRVNDRGPFAKSRILDVSKHGAQLLGFQNQGTAKVRVEIMAEESRRLKNAILNKTNETIAINQPELILPGKENPMKSENSSQIQAIGYAKGQYYVQAGSFSQQNIATELSRQLKKFGTVNTIPAEVNGRNYYRVRVGPYANEEAAQAALNKVLNFGVANATVIKD